MLLAQWIRPEKILSPSPTRKHNSNPSLGKMPAGQTCFGTSHHQDTDIANTRA
jgi:hypothetical protein